MDDGQGKRWSWVARSMAAGAIYDLAFAVAILFFTVPAAGLLGLALPDDLVYLRFNGIFLVLLAGTYMLPAVSPERYQGVVAVAVGGRFLGFVYLGQAWLAGAEPAFVGLALGDLFFALVHAVLLLRARAA